MAALIVSYASSLRAWSEQQSRLADLRAEKAERAQRVAELEREVERWQDPAYVEAQARERFGWVMPGEVGYRVIGVDGKIQGELSAPTDVPDPTVTRWYNVLWGSVEAAGRQPGTTRTADPDKVLRE
jgi:hypothetical protein